MKNFFPYNPASEQVIDVEPHKIIGGQIRLDHIPKENSLTVRGFVEAKSASNLQPNEFFCAYRADTQYREANCLVYFYRGRSGQTVYCSYIAVGSVVTADVMNEIREHLIDAEDNFSALKVADNDLKALLLEVRNEARDNLNEHNRNSNSHVDIRDEISRFKIDNADSHADLLRRINDVAADLNAYKISQEGAIRNAVTEHDQSVSSHPAIRDALNQLSFTMTREEFLAEIFKE